MALTENKITRAADELRKVNILKRLYESESRAVPEIEPLPDQMEYSEQAFHNRLAYLKKQTGSEFPFLSGTMHFKDYTSLQGNIENFIGFAQVPVGVAGPVRIKGSEANGDYFIPLATSEGALVASYSRGMKACRSCGDIISVCLMEGVQRSPLFRFDSVLQMGRFTLWLLGELDKCREIVTQASRFAQLNDVKLNIEGNSVIVIFEYLTGDAAGQNMVTLCTHKICEYLVANAPVKPNEWFVEGNYSGDKKATALSFTNVRGKKVTAEKTITRQVVEKVLKTTPEKMHTYWQSSTLAVIQSGAIGAQGHVANGLAALFIACGQDAACVSEAAVGITRMEVTQSGDLYVSVTLPNLIVGTVGGGTHLPTQKECLQLLDCYGEGKARRLAEICGAVALAGEVSIAAALSAGHFASAHAALGRKQST